MEEVLEAGEGGVVEEEAAALQNSKKLVTRILGGVALLAAVIGSGWYWVESQKVVETDNAFVESRIHSVSSRVPGTVARVLVEDNQFVHKGDLLVTLDERDFAVRLSDARAGLDMARNDTSGDLAQVEAARAELQRTKAQLAQAELDLKRASALVEREVMPREQLDRRSTDREVALAQVREAEQRLKKAQAALGLAGAGRQGAREAKQLAQVEEGALNLSYTRVYAPADGYVTRKSVEVGNRVQAGQALLAVVPLSEAWITANLKESQLGQVRAGQKVQIRVDAYPGRTFTGTVTSIMSGTGAAFSLLPPENATGNYVKVVQRVPVKIAIDRSSDPEHLLRVGMSVVPSIQVPRSSTAIVRDLLHLS
ncbi:RND transporter [Geomonas silvestris]|uniref:RND transporter n=1 Tax=Geomonas silvestris TaxID=2740184 RepID=A0A6V8MDR2_9BACT|nr:HlyD family secretion protein [Geomonas silvestris]GFO58138.1 RND transporter [Geomonas silvestris]